MLTREENELLTRTGPGTPMGDLFRRYWLPVMLSEEVEADGAPTRIRILSEDLVAFRDTEGKVGFLEESCPHRGASLALARNEEMGLRCLYHGWKFDRAGRCMDMPSEPADSNFKNKVGARSYLAHEAGDVIWIYMGEPNAAPPFPAFQWTALPKEQRAIGKALQESNWLQGMEGGIDTSHASFLHNMFGELDKPEGTVFFTRMDLMKKDTAPRLQLQPTNYGFRYAALRHAGDDQQYVRITPFIMPCHSYPPAHQDEDCLYNAWVPRDDYSCWFWDIYFHEGQPVIDTETFLKWRGLEVDKHFRKIHNQDNFWDQDRDLMRWKSWSGIPGIPVQDAAVQESMGPIYNRSKEHLGTSDTAVIAARRLLLQEVRAVAEGKAPLGTDPAIPYPQIRGEGFLIPEHTPWQEANPLRPGFVPSKE